MLAALLQNNNNARVEERPPTIHVDRGGGGPLWGPRYDIVDIASAVAAFPEVAGEDSVVRAIRRTRWIGEALPRIKEARERQQAVAFLAGVQVADRAAREEFAAAEKFSIEQFVQIIDEVRGHHLRTSHLACGAGLCAPCSRGAWRRRPRRSAATSRSPWDYLIGGIVIGSRVRAAEAGALRCWRRSSRTTTTARVEERPPTIHVDRGGGGPLWGPRSTSSTSRARSRRFPKSLAKIRSLERCVARGGSDTHCRSSRRPARSGRPRPSWQVSRSQRRQMEQARQRQRRQR